jgi:replicative DNA helicase
MTDDVQQSVLNHKKNHELLFCACAFSNAEMVKKDCGWLSPDIFTSYALKAFWKDLQNDIPPTEAAINNVVLNELVSANTQILSTLEYPSYAQAILDDDYLLNIAMNLGPVAESIGSRDLIKTKKLIDKITDKKQVSNYEIPSAYDVAMDFAETLGLDNQVVNTYISPLDNSLGGMAIGTLNLIAARPSMGKTGLAWQIARNMATNGKKVIYFSVEMSATALWARAACGILEYDIKDYYNNKLTKEQISKIVDVTGSLMNKYGENLRIDDRSRITSEDIWKAVSKYTPDCIVVDHISLLSDKADNEIKRLGNITWTGKQIAKEYKLVSIYLQQLNRGTEYRSGDARRPTMSDLRDSGETEQNADTVTFIYRPDYYEVGTPPIVSDTELIIAKNRNGERNIIANTKYHLKRQWFYSRVELEQESEIRRTR